MARKLEDLSIDEIRQRYLNSDEPVSPSVLTRLQRDPRQGVRRIHATLKKRFERERDERVRMAAMLHFEQLLWRSGVQHIAGVDEAGVGPLAGPVVAAAVVFPPDTVIGGMNDSKQLEAEVRAELEAEIRGRAAGIGIGTASVEEIDRLNIYHAALLAMQRAVLALPVRPQHVLVDARTIPGLDMPQNPFARGDGLNFTIAAASIIAKNERDRMMVELDREFPDYGFAGNKGYGTPDHRAALERLGPSAAHRMSFPVIAELRGEYSPLFYALRSRLQTARSPDELRAFELAFKDDAASLSEAEAKKLRLLCTRRWKTAG